MFRLRSFDLVLLDAALGGFGATELLRRLRSPADGLTAGPPRTEVPILLVAAAPDEVAEEDVLATGADGVFYAPLDLEEIAPRLLAIVAAWRRAHPDRPWADEAALA